jgi:hypothetical protein
MPWHSRNLVPWLLTVIDCEVCLQLFKWTLGCSTYEMYEITWDIKCLSQRITELVVLYIRLLVMTVAECILPYFINLPIYMLYILISSPKLDRSRM